MRTISSRNTVLLPLGKRGENLARQMIFFDPIAWEKEYGPGTVQLLHQRPGEDTPYPVVIAAEADGSYSWAVTAADTALAGQGKCELRYLSGDTVVKSRTWNTIVGDALGEPIETPPEAQQGWVDQVLQAGTDAQNAADRAEAAAVHQPCPNEETGTWWVWDAEAGKYKDTGISYGGSGGGSVELDTTLKEAGKAADAKAVGDAISTLSEDMAGLSVGGISATARGLLITVLRNGVYNSDQSENITALEAALVSSGSGDDSGGGDSGGDSGGEIGGDTDGVQSINWTVTGSGVGSGLTEPDNGYVITTDTSHSSCSSTREILAWPLIGGKTYAITVSNSGAAKCYFGIWVSTLDKTPVKGEITAVTDTIVKNLAAWAGTESSAVYSYTAGDDEYLIFNANQLNALTITAEVAE